MRFGEPISDARLEALLRPGGGIDTLITADAYGAGEADRVLGRALAGVPRERLLAGGRGGPRLLRGRARRRQGLPPLHRPAPARPGRLRRLPAHGRGAEPRALGVDSFDLLLLHNPDRRGFESPEVWEALRGLRDEGLRGALGVAPGPANGFTLDLIGCFERYGELIDWAMLILNPFEPWPGELALDAAARNDVSVITRVVDYGGLFHDDVLPGHGFAPRRPPRLPPGGLGRGRPRAARAHQADRRPSRAHAAPACVRVEPRAPRRRVRRADADPGAGA